MVEKITIMEALPLIEKHLGVALSNVTVRRYCNDSNSGLVAELRGGNWMIDPRSIKNIKRHKPGPRPGIKKKKRAKSRA